MNDPRRLGLVSATALVVASMIGAGVFTTSGFTLGDLKSPWIVLAAWAVGGVLAGLGALSYGALARRIPESGGEYLFLSRTLHPAAGYVAGWISLLVGFSAPLAAAAFALGEYNRAWLPEGWDPKLTGTLAILVFTVVHGLEVKPGAWVQNATVIVKVLLIGVFIALAFGRTSIPASQPIEEFSWAMFGVSLVWISFSYSGWNAAVYIGGEVKNPERNLPLALALGTGTVMVLYLLLNAVFVFSAPASELAGKVQIGQIAARALGGSTWANGVTLLVSLALLSSVSSLIMAGPRVYAKMAEDGYLPGTFVPKDGPPRLSILLQSVLALLMMWSATYDKLLTYIGFTLSLSTAATVVGLIRARLQEGKKLPVPGWPWVPGIYLVGVCAMAVFCVALRPRESLAGLGTIAVGLLAWWFDAKRLARLKK